jgi:hypothetical protein
MVCDLPHTEVFDYYEAVDGRKMDFRLIYRGSLPAEGSGGSRTKEKQMLRKHFHKQLRELWKQHPDLRSQAESRFYKANVGQEDEQILYVDKHDRAAKATDVKTWVEHIADDHQRCGGRFVPLISERGGFTCALDILFLRRDNPGHLIASGGDIDNRIKVLFEGLKMPSTVTELVGCP